MKNSKVGIWIRVSTSMQAQGDSPEHHEERAKAFAQLRGFEVVETYHLEGVSGKSVMQHHEAKRMVNDIKRGHIDGVIFSQISRLARDTKELLEIADLFSKHNASLISIEQPIDTSTPTGRLAFTQSAGIVQWERETIAERVAASIPIRAKLGKTLGGQAPFGYAWEDKKLVVHEEEATIRCLMYDLFLKHKRKKTVARLLNEGGHRTRKGANFSGTTITRLLEDPIAKGVRLVNYTTVRTGKKEIKSESDWVYQEAPAIIDAKKWQDVQDILKEQAPKNKKPLNRMVHLFTGYAICRCGTKMYTRSKHVRYICQNCNTKIEAEVLEAIFKEQLLTFSISETSATEILNQGMSKQDENIRLLEVVEKDITKVKQRIDSIFELHESGQLETHDFQTHYKEPKERFEALTEQREKLKNEMQSFSNSEEITHHALSLVQDVYGKWEDLEQQDKRNIIESMIETIIIDEDSVEIQIKQLNPLFL